jgi:hypothetical protein
MQTPWKDMEAKLRKAEVSTDTQYDRQGNASSKAVERESRVKKKTPRPTSPGGVLQHTVYWHPTTNRCPPPHIVQEEVPQHTVY